MVNKVFKLLFPSTHTMEYSTGKRVEVVGITIVTLMLALVSYTYPLASASRVLFHGSQIEL
jgi:hypothetical protein